MSREREKGGHGEEKEKKGREETEKEGKGGGLEIFQASSVWGPTCRSEMPYHMTCLTFDPHSAQAVRLLSSVEHKASKAAIHPPPQRAAVLQR